MAAETFAPLTEDCHEPAWRKVVRVIEAAIFIAFIVGLAWSTVPDYLLLIRYPYDYVYAVESVTREQRADTCQHVSLSVLAIGFFAAMTYWLVFQQYTLRGALLFLFTFCALASIPEAVHQRDVVVLEWRSDIGDGAEQACAAMRQQLDPERVARLAGVANSPDQPAFIVQAVQSQQNRMHVRLQIRAMLTPEEKDRLAGECVQALIEFF